MNILSFEGLFKKSITNLSLVLMYLGVIVEDPKMIYFLTMNVYMIIFTVLITKQYSRTDDLFFLTTNA